MKTIDITGLARRGVTLDEFLSSPSLQKELACGSDGIVMIYLNPRTREESRYWLRRTLTSFEQLAPKEIQ